MRLSVIIVTHNSADALVACWSSVRSQFAESEIIVVDNASTDATRQICDTLDGVTVIANSVNAGFGRACNAGAAAATGSHLLLLNPDVELDDVDWEDLRAEFESPQFGLVAPIIESGTHHNSTVPFWPRELLHHAAGFLRPRELPTLPRLALRPGPWWPAGAVLFAQRDEFLGLGGFDRRFFLYYEDLDLSRRYRAAGLPVRMTRAVRAVHHHGSSSTGETSGVAIRHAWSYLSWIEYLSIWNGPATARSAAHVTRLIRSQVDHVLAVLERVGPIGPRIARKRHELAEVERLVQWQSSFAAGTVAADFCPRARRIVASR